MSAFVSEAVRLKLESLERERVREVMNNLVGKDFAKGDYRQAVRDMRDE